MKEWLAYGVFPGGIVVDQERWNGGTPQHGYLYSLTSVGSIISIADHLARLGDVELYTHSTIVGLHGTAGTPPKTLLSVLQHGAALTNGTLLQYASLTSTSDPLLRIDQSGPTDVRVEYVNLAPANLYYRDTSIKTAYTTAIPGSFDTGGFDVLRGEWGNYPRIRFMFGSMEGLHNPFAAVIEYHIASTGSDTVSCATAKTWSSNPANAKRTSQGGINCATAPGDIVSFHVGTYVPSSTVNTVASGTSGNPITIRAYPGDLVTIQGQAFQVNGHDWIVLRDFTIDLQSLNVIAGANDVQLINMRNTNAPIHGIVLDGSAGALNNILIDGCEVMNAGTLGGGGSGIRGSPDNLTVQKTNITIQNCTLHDNDEDGIGFSNVTGITIKDNTIYNNGEEAVDIKQISSNILIEHNTVYDNTAGGILINPVNASDNPPIAGGPPLRSRAISSTTTAPWRAILRFGSTVWPIMARARSSATTSSSARPFPSPTGSPCSAP